MAERIYADDFQAKVLDSPVPVLVDFYSDSCIACKKLAPTLCDVEEDYEGKVSVFKVNTGYDTKLVQEYEILSNPTLIFFKNGEAVDRQIGAKDYDELTDWIDGLI
ncbi:MULTISPECIES: thioredoxin family protein [Pseudobutyrivibrio]|uniref:Thioredoxin n=1 Tax=Pseudobutyrivibrio xylanivorans TaxID=185007 RepID=A0A1G5RT15_PSEXY|nr:MULTISPECIES: thioredoxin domain-containing protein [Pseudobutyrivibrio]MDC7278507.1 thioredoxin family protein [Butyrivibrio fibrisolvens]SCZ77127.1 thioredoxin 1 [Pseudobutyrivibrio xylanivorans]SDI13515.1 thioredoxin 1 [Pseudobutyrivibrio sp. 49]